MWFFALHADLARTWLSAMEAATKTCADATRAYTEAWSTAASPPAARGLQFTLPFAQPGFNVWSTNPFFPFGAMMPWMMAPWITDWHRQLSPASYWQMPIGAVPFPWANWAGSTMTPAAVADLMSASYRTASGHATAAAILLAPLQPKPVAQTWFGWPFDARRGYLN